jgi:hypothetical protein
VSASGGGAGGAGECGAGDRGHGGRHERQAGRRGRGRLSCGMAADGTMPTLASATTGVDDRFRLAIPPRDRLRELGWYGSVWAHRPGSALAVASVEQMQELDPAPQTTVLTPLLARYDRDVAAILLRPMRDELAWPGHAERRASTDFIAWALIDSRGAADRLAAIEPSPQVDSNANRAITEVAECPARSGQARWS